MGETVPEVLGRRKLPRDRVVAAASAESPAPESGTFLRRSFAAFGAAFIALCALAAFRDSPTLWGVHYAAYLPATARVLLLAGAAAALAPLVAKPAAAFVEDLAARAARFATSNSKSPRPIVAVAALLTALLLWMLRDSTHLLGDGQLLIQGIESGRWWLSHEGLDFAAHAAVHRVASLAGASSGATTYVVMSIAAGLLYLATAASLARTIGRSPAERMFVFAVLSCLGFAQVFFGYVESYSFAFPAVLLYLRSAHRAIAGHDRVWKAVALYLLLVLLHSTFVVYALSLGVVFFHALRRKGMPAGGAIARSAAAAALLGLALGGAVLFSANLAAPGDTAKRAAHHTLPLFMSADVDRPILPYAVFSRTHAANLANEALLVVPGVLVLALALAAAASSRRLGSLPKARSGFLVCACAAWIPHALGFLFFRPGYGAFGDWDLLALPAPAFAVSVATAAVYLASRRDLGVLMLATCGLQSLTLVPQILVNADAERSVKRYLYLLREYPQSWDTFTMGIAYVNVARHFASRGDHRQVMDLGYESLRAVSWSPTLYERALSAFAARLESVGQSEEAVALYRDRIGVVETRFRNATEQVRVSKAAGAFFYRHEDYAEACRFFELAASADTSEYDAVYALAAAQNALGRRQDAERTLEEAMRRTPAQETRKRAAGYLLLSHILTDAGERDRSIDALKRGLELDPQDPELRAAFDALSKPTE